MGLELWARIRRESTADPPQRISGGSSGRYSCPPAGERGPHGGFVIAISFVVRLLGGSSGADEVIRMESGSAFEALLTPDTTLTIKAENSTTIPSGAATL